MFIDRLLSQGNQPVLEQVVRFTAARHRLIAENVANLSTPGYAQRDLDEASFYAALRERTAARRSAPPGTVRFDDLAGEAVRPRRGVLFHDRNNRSVEQLMADAAENAMRHNLMVELMRRQFSSIQNALKERVS